MTNPKCFNFPKPSFVTTLNILDDAKKNDTIFFNPCALHQIESSKLR